MAIFFVLSAHQYPTSMVLTMYLVGYCQPQGRISATCATSVWRKEIKPHIYVISNISVCKLSTYVAARPAIWLVWNYSISITQMMPWTNQPITCLLKPLMHSFEPPVFLQYCDILGFQQAIQMQVHFTQFLYKPILIFWERFVNHAIAFLTFKTLTSIH